MPPPQFATNLLLIAVHDLLLDGADDELGACYPSVAHRRSLEPRRSDPGAVAQHFESFCRSHVDEVLARTTTRATQTNEVGRCPAIRAAIASLRSPRPVALLDVGCSAGLNLFFDEYRCAYDGKESGGTSLPLLDTALRGAAPPLELPDVGARVGLDRAPIDPSDPASARWLLACLWPDDLERFERLEAALCVAASRRDQATLVPGDMVDDLATAAAACDDDELVVLTTWAAAYLPEARRHDLLASLKSLAKVRPTTWVAMESPRAMRDLGLLPAGAPLLHETTAICVARLDGAHCHRTLVGTTHHHGRWLDWWPAPRSTSDDDA